MDRVLCAIFCIVAIVVAVCVLVYCSQPTADVVLEPTVEPTVAENTEAITEPTETEVPTTVATEPVETEPPVVLYDVPLDEDLQLHIIKNSKETGIDPAIIIAMARKETTYREDAIGDNGNSLGLLQIQPRWHSGRMNKLGCTDLLDPYQNVIVGIDYLCELLNRYGSMDKALTAYNQGHYNGVVTQYAKTVLAYAEQINNERSQ